MPSGASRAEIKKQFTRAPIYASSVPIRSIRVDPRQIVDADPGDKIDSANTMKQILSRRSG